MEVSSTAVKDLSMRPGKDPVLPSSTDSKVDLLKDQ
jgi:hypothetical protein